MNILIDRKIYEEKKYDIDKFIQQTKNKKIREALELILRIDERNISMFSYRNSEKINEFAKDESYYFLDAVVKEIKESIEILNFQKIIY